VGLASRRCSIAGTLGFPEGYDAVSLQGRLWAVARTGACCERREQCRMCWVFYQLTQKVVLRGKRVIPGLRTGKAEMRPPEGCCRRSSP
jgi:hypothetical protein